MTTKRNALIGLALLTSSLLSAAPVAAQDADPGAVQCNGQDATIVALDWEEGAEASVLGTPGNDVIVAAYSGSVQLFIDAGAGDDIVCVVGTSTLAEVASSITGGAGNDLIFGGSADDDISGDDRPEVLTGDDIIYGGLGRDSITGGNGDDTIFGQQGSDFLIAGPGNDSVHGGFGNDIVTGGDGDDELFGGQGNDFLYGNLGRDTVYGGQGDDLLDADSEPFGESINVVPSPLGITTTSQIADTAGSRMFGGSGVDVLIGGNRWDRMQGGDGNDFLFGLEGRDWMRGGVGDDTIIGGVGIDDINGNLGADRIYVVGADLTRGGFGNDVCVSGANSMAARIWSCERSNTVGVVWEDLTPQIAKLRPLIVID